jgi:hypothetical protein
VEKYGRTRQATDKNVIRRGKDVIYYRITDARIQVHIDFLQQILLRDRASILRYTYIASLFFIVVLVHAKCVNPRSHRCSHYIVFVQ